VTIAGGGKLNATGISHVFLVRSLGKVLLFFFLFFFVFLLAPTLSFPVISIHLLIQCTPECTYSYKQKSRYAGPMYIEELEAKIESLEHSQTPRSIKSLLAAIFPQVDFEDQDAVENIQKGLLNEEQRARFLIAERKIVCPRLINSAHESPQPDEGLDMMVDATERLEVDSDGNLEVEGQYVFDGDSGVLAFLHHLGGRCNLLLDGNQSMQDNFSHLCLRPGFAAETLTWTKPRGDVHTPYQLPPRPLAQSWSSIALDDKWNIFSFVHRPSFNHMLNRVYSMKREYYSHEEEAFLPLLYLTFALGELLSGPSATEFSTSHFHETRG